MTDGIQNFDFNLTDVGLNSATLASLAPRNKFSYKPERAVFQFENILKKSLASNDHQDG